MWFSQLVASVREQLIRVLNATRAVEAALDCIIVIDHRGRIVEFNPAAERTFGHSRADAIGRDFAELLVPEHLRDLHRLAFARHRRAGDSDLIGRRFETYGLRGDGTAFPVELSLARVPMYYSWDKAARELGYSPGPVSPALARAVEDALARAETFRL